MAREALTPEHARQVVEVALFASDQPITAQRIAQVVGKPFDTRAVREMIDMLNAEYSAQGHAFQIVEIAGGYQMHSRPEFHRFIAELHKSRRVEKLSPSAVETLAIVAYKQPVQRATVDDIRGVQTGPLLRSLLERGLIKVVGRQNVPGHPILYGTTRLFLEHFDLKSLKDLPTSAQLKPPQAPQVQPVPESEILPAEEADDQTPEAEAQPTPPSEAPQTQPPVEPETPVAAP